MKFGTQLGSLGKHDRREALEYGKSLGCQGLEVGLGADGLRTGATTLAALVAEAEAMRRDFEAAGLEFISLSSGLMLKHADYPEVVRASCECAQVLGVRALRMFFSPHVRWGGPNSVLPDWLSDFDGTRDARHWLKTDAENLARLVDLSESYDVRFVFELHHGYTINSASGAMRLLERFPAERVGILMDPGNMVFEGNEGWRNSVQIMGEYLDYIHCKNGAFRREGDRWIQEWASLSEGIARFPEIITALKDLGWEGYLSIEDLRPGLSVEEKVGEGIAYLRDLVESEGRYMPT